MKAEGHWSFPFFSQPQPTSLSLSPSPSLSLSLSPPLSLPLSLSPSPSLSLSLSRKRRLLQVLLPLLRQGQGRHPLRPGPAGRRGDHRLGARRAPQRRRRDPGRARKDHRRDDGAAGVRKWPVPGRRGRHGAGGQGRDAGQAREGGRDRRLREKKGGRRRTSRWRNPLLLDLRRQRRLLLRPPLPERLEVAAASRLDEPLQF